ncbi:RNA-binding domain-containing protein [Trametes cingulata]|nr:RNA-binding domain-containing protein [Trametes cingulata]
MSSRGRSLSPRPLRDEDVDMDRASPPRNPHAKVVIVTNLTRNVVESHLQTIFGFYGEIVKVDLPLYGKSGQNRGRAALEYADSASAQKAVSHMDGGQLDGAILKCELSEQPIRSRSYSRSRSRSRSPRPPPRTRYGRGKSYSRSPSRSRSPPPPPRGGRRPYEPRYNEPYRRPPPGRRPPPPRDTYRRYSRSRTRSRSPPRRGGDRLPPRRRSPSYERGGRARSRSYSVASSRSRTRSLTPRSRSRSPIRSRSRSYYSSSGYSRSVSRSRSPSRGRRSYSRDDIRDSRSRSPRD